MVNQIKNREFNRGLFGVRERERERECACVQKSCLCNAKRVLFVYTKRGLFLFHIGFSEKKEP